MRRDLRYPHKSKPDYVLMLVVFFLLAFGLVILSSTSWVESQENFGTSFYYFQHQLLYGGVTGLIAFFIFSKINYHWYKKIAVPFFIFALILLVLVLAIGPNIKGAQRWLSLGPIFFQPVELMKLALVLYLAAWFTKVREKIHTWKQGFFPFVVLLGILTILVLAQPDMGSFMMLSIIGIAMYFVAGAPWKHLLVLAAGGTAAMAYLISVAPYRVARFTVFLHPELDPGGAGYQINQALLAVGTGGILGRGLNNSLQKHNYLPEASTDSVFAIMSEELGLIRTMAIVFLFFLLAWRGYDIARRAEDPFGRLLAVGITSWVTFQAFINIMAILSLVPLTGIPLPFVSYGSSSLILTMAAMGILMNVSRYAQPRTKQSGLFSQFRRG